jgi:hypothetical protein
MNYMPKVLEMLGVEVGEKFDVKRWSYNPHQFDEDFDLVNKYGNCVSNTVIVELLKGTYEIEKLPWKPKDDEIYYFICTSGNVLPSTWCGNGADYYRFNAGNYFRTAEEITLEIKQRILQEMKGKYEND